MDVYFQGIVHFVFPEDWEGENDKDNIIRYISNRFLIVHVKNVDLIKNNRTFLRYYIDDAPFYEDYIEFVERLEDKVETNNILLYWPVGSHLDIDSTKQLSKLIDVAQRISFSPLGDGFEIKLLISFGFALL
jgi:hypothetical protein